MVVLREIGTYSAPKASWSTVMEQNWSHRIVNAKLNQKKKKNWIKFFLGKIVNNSLIIRNEKKLKKKNMGI